MASARKLSKERTRNRLLQGTLRILLREGVGGLTTGRVAEMAGVAQPTFYVHFNGMDDALQQAADQVGGRVLERLDVAREGFAGEPHLRLTRVLSAYTDALLADGKNVELLLRHRRDTGTPLGPTWTRVIDEIRRDLVVDLRTAGLGDRIPGLDLHAELILGSLFGLVEAILDRRVLDRGAAVDAWLRGVEANLEAQAQHAAAAAE